MALTSAGLSAALCVYTQLTCAVFAFACCAVLSGKVIGQVPAVPVDPGSHLPVPDVMLVCHHRYKLAS